MAGACPDTVALAQASNNTVAKFIICLGVTPFDWFSISFFIMMVMVVWLRHEGLLHRRAMIRAPGKKQSADNEDNQQEQEPAGDDREDLAAGLPPADDSDAERRHQQDRGQRDKTGECHIYDWVCFEMPQPPFSSVGAWVAGSSACPPGRRSRRNEPTVQANPIAP